MLEYQGDQGKRFRAIMLGTTELNMSTQFELFFQEDEKIQRLYRFMDYLNNGFGLDTVEHGIGKFGVKGNTHFKELSI